MFANLSHNAYWILAGFNTIGFILVFFLWPETKSISLEQMDVVFGSINRVEAALQEDEASGDVAAVAAVLSEKSEEGEKVKLGSDSTTVHQVE